MGAFVILAGWDDVGTFTNEKAAQPTLSRFG
jgi:hypothetical protein